MMRYIKRGMALAISVVLPVISQHSVADVDVTFHGTLVETAPCTVNNGEQIVVNFGDNVQTTRIAQKSELPEMLYVAQYSQIFSINVTCADGAGSYLPTLFKIKGEQSPFDSTGLAGDREGFWFAFGFGASRLPVNSWVSISGNSLNFAVAPVRKDNYVPDGGAFSTLASLIVDYQ